MSGETARQESGWTVDTLKTLMDERDAHLKELRVSDQRAVDAALVSQEKAIVKAETAADKRFELLNELRSGVATKEQLEGLEKVVVDLKDRINVTHGKSSGLQAGWGYLIATIGLAATVVTVILAFNN